MYHNIMYVRTRTSTECTLEGVGIWGNILWYIHKYIEIKSDHVKKPQYYCRVLIDHLNLKQK